MTTHETFRRFEDDPTTRRRLRWGLAVFLLIAVFFLWEEHRAHLLGALPWLLLLACPLMHRFMHHGHGSHHQAPEAHEAHGSGGMRRGEGETS